MSELDVKTTSDASGCTTAPVIGIYDATAHVWLATVTMAAGQFSYYSPVSPNQIIPAGDHLQFGVETAGVGCTTTSGIFTWAMTYYIE